MRTDLDAFLRAPMAALAISALAACGTVTGPEQVDAMVVGAADAGPDAAPSGCTRKTESRTDPNTGARWDSIWFCGNDGGAALYLDASAGTPVANMDTQWSWFVCFRHGAAHAGGNDVWYYTEGDRAVPGAPATKLWGYMSAVNVKAEPHPYPGVPACP
jgi:hypothetical protein